jgi:diguanylate cyclase (GGDEF)-like protein
VSASFAIHDISGAMSPGSSTERRRHARYPVQVVARLALPGGELRSCQIRDFGAGGLFLAIEETENRPGVTGAETLSPEDRVEVQFTGEQGVSGRVHLATVLHSITAPVARVMPTGVGLSFTNLDAPSVQAVRQLAVLARATVAPRPATVINPASVKPPVAVMGDAMHTVRCLLRLEHHMRSADSTPESVAAIAISEPAPSRVDPLARELIVDALIILQRAPEFLNPDENEPLALQDRLMSTCEAAGLNVTEADGIVVEIVSMLLDGMLDDPLVGPEIKQCIRRLAIALVKVALQDGYFFFANEQHPARLALNRLGSLEPSIIGADRWRTVIDPLLTKALADSDKGGKTEGYVLRGSAFNEILPLLDDLFEEQTLRYDDFVASVVREQLKQQTLLDSLGAADAAADTPEAEAEARKSMPLELQRWLGHVDQLRTGNVLYRRVRESRIEKLSLASVSENRSRYLYVDAAGRKAATVTRQELAMQLRRGELWMVDASKLPIVERGLFRMLNKLHQRIARVVNLDEASGLLNRKGLEARVHQALSSALTMGSGHALCILELDALGPIVQKCGQQVAGELLRNFIPVLQKHVRNKGVAARLQAGRFAVLLNNCTADSGTAVMDALRAAMQTSRCKWHEESFDLTIGVGLAVIDAHSGSVLTVFEAADEAYQRARSAGGNRVHVYQRSGSAGDDQLAASAKISSVIANGGLQLRCQRVTPIGADASALPQYELLLGVRNEAGEVSLPGNLLRAAERNNQMREIDRWVIETAVRWMGKNADKLERIDGYSINISGSTLADENLVDYVRGLMASTRVRPGKIIFEVTESAAIDSLPAAVNFIHAINEYGCRVCLDKFGSAEASLAHLETLPIDYVKIDGALVRNIAADPRDLMVVRSLNELGHFLGKKTVAESVESPAVLARLRQIGVDYAQGFAIEKPFLLQ